MQISEFIINNPVGLHARPAALFVKLANQFTAEISIKNLSGEGEWVNAKSILSLLTAGVAQGHRIAIRTEGCDEVEALEALSRLIRSDFSENNQGGT